MVSRKWLFAGLQAAAEVTSIDGERRKVEVVGGAMKTASCERTRPGAVPQKLTKYLTENSNFVKKNAITIKKFQVLQIICVIIP